VAARFVAAAAPRTREGERGAGRTDDELARAYALLGVASSASDAEVARAWRRRLLEVHPDRAAGDATEFARRTQLAAELNRARDLIRAARRRAREGASA
jgi:curved DNA-binding protein CbpA